MWYEMRSWEVTDYFNCMHSDLWHDYSGKKAGKDACEWHRKKKNDTTDECNKKLRS